MDECSGSQRASRRRQHLSSVLRDIGSWVQRLEVRKHLSGGELHVSQGGWDTVSGVTSEGWAVAQRAGLCRLWTDFAFYSVRSGKPLEGLSWAGGSRGDPVPLTLCRKQHSDCHIENSPERTGKKVWSEQIKTVGAYIAVGMGDVDSPKYLQAVRRDRS